MASLIKIKNRDVTASPGTPTTLAPGELAFNRAGLNADDETAGGALFAGSDVNAPGSVEVLVSNTRQVELIGNQTVAGNKTFTGLTTIADLTIGTGATDYGFPTARGLAGQVLALDANATDLEFRTLLLSVNRNPIPTGAGPDIEDDFNAVTDWSATGGDQTTTTFDVGPGELWVLNWNGTAYAWLGGTGSFGTAAGGTAAIASDFGLLGSSTDFATAAEVQAGTVADKAIAPNIAASDLFRTQIASGNQAVATTVSFNGNLTMGAAGTGITIDAPDATLQGTAANPLIIDEAILDGGAF